MARKEQWVTPAYPITYRDNKPDPVGVEGKLLIQGPVKERIRVGADPRFKERRVPRRLDEGEQGSIHHLYARIAYGVQAAEAHAG